MPESKRSFMLMSPLSMETVTSVNPPELSAAQPFVNIWVHFAQLFRDGKVAEKCVFLYFVISIYVVSVELYIYIQIYIYKYKDRGALSDKLLWRMGKDERCLLFGWPILCIHIQS